ncbi:hypothetical protein DLAC_03087 [Tieghemostelium lacteum]|uniref:Uncharacterized protein n=1 Tax=Tieghemostelium lacteum TaxID=361077 RepID=A0A152A2B5_TIELA|nr:hypothetical protein DLAC_03087 [Tieghemostelium lacteum]|eukprot:KYR00344.1 hypothetical protein DLAC_03087 [Tieghemostelium lacteum]
MIKLAKITILQILNYLIKQCGESFEFIEYLTVNYSLVCKEWLREIVPFLNYPIVKLKSLYELLPANISSIVEVNENTKSVFPIYFYEIRAPNFELSTTSSNGHFVELCQLYVKGSLKDFERQEKSILLQNLKKLYINTDSNVEIMAKLIKNGLVQVPKLETITYSRSNYYDVDEILKIFQDINSRFVDHLIFQECVPTVTPPVKMIFSNLKSLEFFNCSGLKFLVGLLDFVTESYCKLEKLSLVSCNFVWGQYDKILTDTIQFSKSIVNLNIQSNSVIHYSSICELLSANTTLKELSINARLMVSKKEENFINMTLERLEMHTSTDLKYTLMNFWTGTSSLVYLSDSKFTEFPVGAHPRLKVLAFDNFSPSERDKPTPMELISTSSTNLRKLVFGKYSKVVYHDSFKSLSSMIYLKKLVLIWEIGIENAISILTNTSTTLETLLFCSGMNIELKSAITSNKFLKTLIYKSTCFIDALESSLIDVLENNHTLYRLEFQAQDKTSYMTPLQIKNLCGAIKKNENIHFLNIEKWVKTAPSIKLTLQQCLKLPF